MSYNPFSDWGTTGTWADHASYSQGGIDKPLGGGTPLPAAASGTLRISGGSGEFQAGFVGSAGRRSILELDVPLKRRVAASPGLPPEGSGDCVAIVYQHQSAFGAPRHYDEREILGYSGNSDGTLNGGQWHLHWHGLNAAGQRVNIESFLGSSPGPSGGGSTPIDNTYTIDQEDEMPEPIYAKGDTQAAVYAIYTTAGANNPEAALQGNVYCARRKVEAGEYAAVTKVGFPNPAQKELVVIKQADFDKIPKVFGSA